MNDMVSLSAFCEKARKSCDPASIGAGWDYIIITASNEHQAYGYSKQLSARRLAPDTHFAVIADEGGERTGSGGATLSAIRYIMRREGKLAGLKILCIHSGGDSKRVPQYSALGKLFSPVPREGQNGKCSTLFDEFMTTSASLAPRIKEGMLVLSGDVVLLFDAGGVDFDGSGAAVISFPENVRTGKEHGVFLGDENGNVGRFFHKQSEEKLLGCGAVDGDGNVNIDTGAIILGTDVLSSLWSLVDTEEKYRALVNSEVRLSLYGDFQYPMADASTLEAFYSEAPEGKLTPSLHDARTLVWNALSGYRLRLIKLSPARFIHFGTSGELLRLMTHDAGKYAPIGWSKSVCSVIPENVSGYCSVAETNAIGDGCFLENSFVHGTASIGNGCIVSFIDISEGIIPENTVIHGLKLIDGRFVTRLFGTDDNPKENRIFGCEIDDFLSKNNLSASDIWDSGAEHTLWNARFYPVAVSQSDATAATLNFYEVFFGHGDIALWLGAERTSLSSAFEKADHDDILRRISDMEALVNIAKVGRLAEKRMPAGKCAGTLNAPLTELQKRWLCEKLSHADFSLAVRLHYYVGTALGEDGEDEISLLFKTVRDGILSAENGGEKNHGSLLPVCKKSEVRLPLRVNFGGGWSDTPPYCNENGGCVLNAAIKLDGKLPVYACVEKISESKVVFESRDTGAHGEFFDIGGILRADDPSDDFALHKAALIACGIISGESLEAALSRIGGGIKLTTDVSGVPKGSGLGTSSILSAACVKCLYGFFGIEYKAEDIYSRVICMEQIMTTGGGWQDQVGGLTDGIKYITSQPGIKQCPKVEYVRLSESVRVELQSRFALIYTGQKRLARNLLRDVIGNYVGGSEDSVYALGEIKNVAREMKSALEAGNIDGFAAQMNRHLVLSGMIYGGTSNDRINAIFGSIDDMTDGKMICGAGGGGFLQVIMKKGVTQKELQKRLDAAFPGDTVCVRECELV